MEDIDPETTKAKAKDASSLDACSHSNVVDIKVDIPDKNVGVSAGVRETIEQGNLNNPKVVEMFGESTVAGRKPKQILGDAMSQDQITKMKAMEEEEHKAARRKSISEMKKVLEAKGPTEEQQELELSKHLSKKAISTFGDEKVRMKSAYVVETPSANPKVVEMFGESTVAGRKPKQILGDAMSQDQITKMKAMEEEEHKAARRKSISEMKKVLEAKGPTEEQQELELSKHLSKKAISTLGDEKVRRASQQVVEQPTNSAKAVKLLGHSKVRGRKAHALLGSPMTEDQLKKQKHRTLSKAQPYVGDLNLTKPSGDKEGAK